MRVHSPTSRSGSRIYLSIWDLFWALVSPILALYLRDIAFNRTPTGACLSITGCFLRDLPSWRSSPLGYRTE